MEFFVDWLRHYGLVVVFANVLLAQIGLPLPAYPVLVVAGALSARGHHGLAALLLTSLGASLVADLLWYAAGRRYGGGVLKTLCRVSMSPDSCVRQTESIFARWGLRSLAVAKFIPGFAVIATSIAGNLRVSLSRFLLFDAIGAALWAGVAIGLGYLFYDAVTALLDALARLGRAGLWVVLGGFALFALYRWRQRRLFLRELRMARTTVHALRVMPRRAAGDSCLRPLGAASATATFRARSRGRWKRVGATVSRCHAISRWSSTAPARTRPRPPSSRSA